MWKPGVVYKRDERKNRALTQANTHRKKIDIKVFAIDFDGCVSYGRDGVLVNYIANKIFGALRDPQNTYERIYPFFTIFSNRQFISVELANGTKKSSSHQGYSGSTFACEVIPSMAVQVDQKVKRLIQNILDPTQREKVTKKYKPAVFLPVLMHDYCVEGNGDPTDPTDYRRRGIKFFESTVANHRILKKGEKLYDLAELVEYYQNSIFKEIDKAYFAAGGDKSLGLMHDFSDEYKRLLIFTQLQYVYRYVLLYTEAQFEASFCIEFEIYDDRSDILYMLQDFLLKTKNIMPPKCLVRLYQYINGEICQQKGADIVPKSGSTKYHNPLDVKHIIRTAASLYSSGHQKFLEGSRPKRMDTGWVAAQSLINKDCFSSPDEEAAQNIITGNYNEKSLIHEIVAAFDLKGTSCHYPLTTPQGAPIKNLPGD